MNLVNIENHIDIESVFSRIVESDAAPDIKGSERSEEEKQEIKRRIVEETADELELRDESENKPG